MAQSVSHFRHAVRKIVTALHQVLAAVGKLGQIRQQLVDFVQTVQHIRQRELRQGDGRDGVQPEVLGVRAEGEPVGHVKQVIVRAQGLPEAWAAITDNRPAAAQIHVAAFFHCHIGEYTLRQRKRGHQRKGIVDGRLLPFDAPRLHQLIGVLVADAHMAALARQLLGRYLPAFQLVGDRKAYRRLPVALPLVINVSAVLYLPDQAVVFPQAQALPILQAFDF